MTSSTQEPAPWLRNAWYVAAWSSEIEQGPLGRTLLDQPVVLFRQSDGRVAAVGGRCPHRFAPLAMGKRVGDHLECPYHGLRFDASGMCVHNPHGSAIPSSARVPSYPVEERWGLVWWWPGAPALADPATIPDLSHLQRGDLAHVTGQMGVNAHYELYVDNLMDLTHAQFVHGDRLMSNNFAAARVGVEQDGNRIANRVHIPDSDVPSIFRSRLPADVHQVDYWMDSFWSPPSIVTNWVGVTRPGRPRDDGLYSYGTHIVTPATRSSAHYFFGHSRNHGLGDADADARIREWQRVGFGEQDKPIIEAVARMMGDETDPLAMRAVLLPTDAAAVRVRRVLARLRSDEAAAAVA
ncbi:MAG TPA: aromatic ring-hydroxylating dioxygenase subunit alpha [Ramlibacter sp.]|nr:aromatic ring-hydroxylating dioxygenase subunit alpha [Ramlibacter sp.]